MMTFFTIPKRSVGAVAQIQEQSRRNWSCLSHPVEVLTYREQDVPTTIQGTPLLNAVFERAAKEAKFDILAYVNADILFMPNLMEAVQTVSSKLPSFLLVGQRIDVPPLNLNFLRAGWERDLLRYARSKGKLHPLHGIDYFIFRRELVGRLAMPAFVVGRPSWDNWMIARCLELGVPVVNGTQRITAIHQNHTFKHLRGGREESRYGPEAQENRRLAGGLLRTIADATHRVEDL